jgi:ammonia channel protein AmtB
VALAGVLAIGPRSGRFPDGEAPRKIQGNNLPVAVLGVLLIWLGWFGFNGGSTLAMDLRVPIIITRTVLAGAAGALACLSCEAITRQLDAAFARVWTVDEEYDELVLQASAGMYTHIDGGHRRV